MATSDSTSNSITIQLNKGYEAIVDECDSDLGAFKWGADVRDNGVYVVRLQYDQNHKATQLRLHRIIMSRILNRVLNKTELVDHWDGNPLNNRRNNLRLATVGQNRSNSKLHKNNKSGFKGVSRVSQSKRWQARIRVNKELIQLGNFDTPEEAHDAYVEAAKKYHGDFYNPG